MTVSLKVSTTDLLVKAEVRLVELKNTSTDTQAKYEQAMEKWRIRAASALVDFVQDVLDALDDETSDKEYKRLLAKLEPDHKAVTVKVQLPKAPVRPYRNYTLSDQIKRVERDLVLLRATTQSEISVRVGSDLASYL